MAEDQGREEDESEEAAGFCHVLFFLRGEGAFLLREEEGGIDWGKSENFVQMPRDLEISDFFFSPLYRIHRSKMWRRACD